MTSLRQLDLFASFDEVGRHSALWTPREIWLRLSETLLPALREDSRIEFKSARKLHWDDLVQYYSMWSNTVDGGVLVFGIEDDRSVSGCGNLNQDQLNKIETFHIQRCPLATRDIRRIPIASNGKSDFLIAIYIPYKGVLVETNKGEAYIRRGADKIRMSVEEKEDYKSTRHERSWELRDCSLSYPGDFDLKTLTELCDSFRAREQKPDWTNEEVLIDRGLLVESEAEEPLHRARNALALIAAKIPRIQIPGCRVRVQRFSGTVEGSGDSFTPIKDFYIEGNIVQILTDAQRDIGTLNYDVTWLNRDGKFVTTQEYPEWAWFEAIVNACVHRSYSYSGSEITVKFFADRLEIESPGGFVPPVNASNIYSQRASRNPFLMDGLRFLGYVRMTREGTRRMRDTMMAWDLPEPSFSQEVIHGVAVRVTLKNDHEIRTRSTNKDVAAYCGVDRWRSLAEHEVAIIGYAFQNQKIHVAEASRLTGRTWNTTKKDLNRLVSKGLLVFIEPKFQRDPLAHYAIITGPQQPPARKP